MQTPQQRSYVLRLSLAANQTALKVSLIDVCDSANKLHFATLEDLYFYLKENVADGFIGIQTAPLPPGEETPILVAV